MHLKSLDHMGIQVKTNDKRNLAAKHLVDVIKTKHEEQRRARMTKGKPPRYQFQYSFKDQELLLDLLRLMVVFIHVSGQHNAQERRRILEFFETFIPQFFDLPDERVQQSLEFLEEASDEEEEDGTLAELSNGRARRNGKKSDLLRGVLDPGRNGSRSRAQKEDSAASGSKETTPDVGSANEEDMPDAPEDSSAAAASNGRWLPAVPGPIILEKGKDGSGSDLLDVDGGLKADAPFPRVFYNFYCNQNIYVFFTVFQTLFKRLEDVKNSKDSVKEEIRRRKAEKPAKLLKLVREDKRYFQSDDAETFWPETTKLIEDFLTGDVDESTYQEVLRHYYLKKGWTLYTIQDLLKTLCRLGLACNNPDAKGEKTKELVKAYLESRQQEETSFQNEISARKFAEKCIKDGEMFVICWVCLFPSSLPNPRLTSSPVPVQKRSHGPLAPKRRNHLPHGRNGAHPAMAVLHLVLHAHRAHGGRRARPPPKGPPRAQPPLVLVLLPQRPAVLGLLGGRRVRLRAEAHDGARGPGGAHLPQLVQDGV